MNLQELDNSDPFLLRAVEYWLDNSNELGYQPLFCKLLLTQGYSVKYSIKNTNFEQGKDVVAVNSENTPYAYQLKGGNISLNRWRKEVKPEIEVLIETPIQHPSISKETPHRSYLVTNGEIDDTVRVEIVALNEKKWKETPLEVITRSDLLIGFLKMSNGILPPNARSYKELMDLIFSDGTGYPDIERISKFLADILKIDQIEINNEQRRRDISAAYLYATMIAGQYRKSNNFIAVSQIMVILLSLIFYNVEKFKLDDKYWKETKEIIWSDILRNSEALEREILDNKYDIEFGPMEDDIVKYRKHSATSLLLALKTTQFILRDTSWESLTDSEYIVSFPKNWTIQK